MKIPQGELHAVVRELLVTRGVPAETSELCASVITESTADGVVSHGIARVPRLLGQLDSGEIRPATTPLILDQPGLSAVESYDGQGGIGISNAVFAADRAMELAAASGIGLVSLRNTSHWLRAGSYGWRAIGNGFALIAWTNTIPNMPAWGGGSPVIGNNPLVIAVPGTAPEGSIVVDMAMSQYSWGQISETRRSGGTLEVAGGWNSHGKLTNDPAEILDSALALPAGYWKGSALSMVLDLFAASLAAGSATAEIPPSEATLSQVFIAVNMSNSAQESLSAHLQQLAAHLQESARDGLTAPRYPGSGTLARREQSGREGIEVPDEVWQAVLAL